MLKKLINIGLIIILLANISIAHAGVQECKEDVARALENVIGADESLGIRGYIQQLEDLTSTDIAINLLIDHVQELARNARIELRGVCDAVDKLATPNLPPNYIENYIAAYDLGRCQGLGTTDTQSLSSGIIFCYEKSDQLLNTFLEQLRNFLLHRAINTSFEPMVNRLRSLNARLTGLLDEYSRVINNFFTFNIRLGDTILGEHD